MTRSGKFVVVLKQTSSSLVRLSGRVCPRIDYSFFFAKYLFDKIFLLERKRVMRLTWLFIHSYILLVWTHMEPSSRYCWTRIHNNLNHVHPKSTWLIATWSKQQAKHAQAFILHCVNADLWTGILDSINYPVQSLKLRWQLYEWLFGRGDQFSFL